MRINEADGQVSLFDQDFVCGRTCPEFTQAESLPARISGSSSKSSYELWMGMWMFLDLRVGGGNLLGLCWEPGFPWLIGLSTAAGGVSPKDAKECSLSSILEGSPHPRYYLSRAACRGILRRAKKREKELPPVLRTALEIQASIPPELLMRWREEADSAAGIKHLPPIAFACNQRDEVRDLHDVAGAVQTQPGMKQQTFIAAGVVTKGNGDCFLTPESHTSITGGGGQAGQGYPCVCAIPINTQVAIRHEQLGDGTGFGIGNEGDPAYTIQSAHSHAVFTEQRLTPWDVQSRRIHSDDGVWPALYSGEGGGHGYVQTGCMNPWDTQQARIVTEDGIAPTVAGADGGGGRNPAGLVFAAFCAGAGAKAKGIGYEQECSPTLKGSAGGNMMPSVLCLNDQGGQRMDLSEDICGALRSQMKGHHPIVMGSQQGGAEICEDLCPTITSAAGTSGNNQPVVFENHGVDSRYAGPLEVVPTISARAGTGGNNLPLAIDSPDSETYAIAGNAVDRQPHNGGNGLGCQQDISYTLTGTDRHCVFSQQRSDEYMENSVASTQSARQYKDSTDLICEVAGLDLRNGNENGDLSGTLQSKTSGGYSLNNLHPIRIGSLVRRLTPLECEALMGFPSKWTDIPGASDSKRYRALGNSVAIPCVEYIMMGIADIYAKEGA